MKYAYTFNPSIMRRFLLVLQVICVMPSLNGSVAVVKKIFQKSLHSLYGEHVAHNECVTCQERTCHRGHIFCPICEEVCQECPVGCNDCRSQCSICLDFHRELQDQKEVVLECNHSFGEVCIKGWEDSSEHKDCPMCRKAIVYRTCALCNDTIREWEASCTYDCHYRWWGWEQEKHVFHRRCIEPYARKAAFVSDNDIRKIKKGDIIFCCPVLHKVGSGNSSTDLKVPLNTVIPLRLYRDETFPSESSVRDKTLCNICHRSITADQKRSSYICKYRDYGWREEEHVFHESCLKPYAERNAHIQKKHGVDTGKIVFHCPVAHECEVWYPHKGDLEIELLPGFRPECVLYFCVVCDKDVEIDHADTIMAEFHGFPGGLNCDRIHEKQYYHRACFGEFVAKTARQKVTWGGVVKVVYPCPCHKDTKWAHDFELSTDLVEIKGPS